MRAAVVATMVLAACLLLPGSVLGQRRKQLSDENFEHMTQAATGQTTGVWFVNFCGTGRACKELAPAWEELGKELLQQQLLLTTVDVHKNPQLRQRFGIRMLPTFLLFRDRKMYRFDGKLIPGTTDVKAVLRAFAQEGYATAAALEVPPVLSPFDWVLKAAEQKLATVKAALEAQDLKALAITLLPVLVVCLLVMLLMGINLGRRKTKRD